MQEQNVEIYDMIEPMQQQNSFEPVQVFAQSVQVFQVFQVF